jgi:hypothetical protein
MVLVAGLLAFAADIIALRLGPGASSMDAGSYRAFLFLSNTYDRELDQAGNAYRWTTAASMLRLNQIGVADHGLLTLHLGGRPQPGRVDLTLNGQPWGGFTADTIARKYSLPVPLRAAGQLNIGINSETFQEPGSPRQLGVKLVAFDLTLPRDTVALPPPGYLLWQVGLLLAGQVIALRLGWSRRGQALIMAGLALAGAFILGAMLLIAYGYLARITIAVAALAGLTWIALPVLERRLAWAGSPREVRLLWALGLAACAIRLLGVLYPTFGGQDLGLNLNRLLMVGGGQMVIIDDSSEFANGLTIYPPGPYLAALPGLLATRDQAAVLQGLLATLDGLSAFLIALLARRLGGNPQAARLALVLYAASYPAFATMTYGFSAQIFGQWFTAPLLLVLLAPPDLTHLRTWAVAAVLLLLQVFSHIGVAILGVTWIGLLLLLLLARPYRALWQPYALMAACGILAFGVLYVDIAAIMLSHVAVKVLPGQPDRALPGATPLLIKGALLAYTEAGLALLPLGLLLIASPERSRRGRTHATFHRRMVLLAMLLTIALFLIVDLVLGLQVRYFYFSLPPALAAIGVILGRLAPRGRWAGAVVWGLALIVVAQNVTLWFQTTIGDGKFSLTPLTH